ncbi:hypothetical protein FRC12_003422 [Ceratobasidium sp. 428]|nr:hypothetical protein FRC12_003422 [Ceratobasidium sp. 428]
MIILLCAISPFLTRSIWVARATSCEYEMMLSFLRLTVPNYADAGKLDIVIPPRPECTPRGVPSSARARTMMLPRIRTTPCSRASNITRESAVDDIIDVQPDFVRRLDNDVTPAWSRILCNPKRGSAASFVQTRAMMLRPPGCLAGTARATSSSSSAIRLIIIYGSSRASAVDDVIGVKPDPLRRSDNNATPPVQPDAGICNIIYPNANDDVATALSARPVPLPQHHPITLISFAIEPRLRCRPLAE